MSWVLCAKTTTASRDHWASAERRIFKLTETSLLNRMSIAAGALAALTLILAGCGGGGSGSSGSTANFGSVTVGSGATTGGGPATGGATTTSGGGAVTAAALYGLGGTISGLTATGLQLTDGFGSAPQTYTVSSLPAGLATPFAFDSGTAYLSAGATFSVSVLQQPTGDRCAVTGGSGTIASTVNDVDVSCTTPTVQWLVNPTDFASVTGQSGFQQVSSVAVDAAGTVYAVDQISRQLLKIAAGVSAQVIALTDLATGASLSDEYLMQIAVGPNGNLFLAAVPSGATGAVIQSVSASGRVSTIAGSGAQGAVNGPGTQASFSNWIKGLAVDAAGNVYVADAANNLVRKVTASGQVSTLAGSGAQGATDGARTSASFDLGGATGNLVAVDANGNVYVVEWPNNDVRKITPDGVVSTLAGGPGRSGFVDGPGATASLANPYGIAIDAAQNIYITDAGSDVRMIMPNGMVSTLASGSAGIVDANGNVVSAGPSSLTCLTSSASGTLYAGGMDSVSGSFVGDIKKIGFH